MNIGGSSKIGSEKRRQRKRMQINGMNLNKTLTV